MKIRTLLLIGITILVFIGSPAAQAGSRHLGLVKAAAETPPLPEQPLIGQLIIKYHQPSMMQSVASVKRQMELLNSTVGVSLSYFRAMSGDAHVLRLPKAIPVEQAEAIAAQLATLPDIEYAEPDYWAFPASSDFIIPDDPLYNNQWHYFAPGSGNYGVNAPGGWEITTGSANVYIGVVDTGILNHADLVNRWTGGYDFISDPLVSNDGDGRDSDPHDSGDWTAANDCYYGSPASSSSWHGTHVAGTIAAASNNSLGVAGLNWVSKVVPVRVLGKCGGYSSDIIDGMRWAAGLPVSGVPSNSHPVKVMNLSLSGYGSCTAAYQNAINDIVNVGAVVVVAAGNSNTDANYYRPANCNNVITVAATTRNGSRAWYSNYGSRVEISAPGGETKVQANGVLSTLNTGTRSPASDTYDYYQGTSMAAPHVSGIVSLMYSLNPALTPAQVLQILQNTVTSFPTGSTCNTSNCGSGIVNAAQALTALQPSLELKYYLPFIPNN
jgi:serine protease